MPVVRLALDAGQPLQALSTSNAHSSVAVACRDHVKVYKLKPVKFLESFTLNIELSGRDNFTLTDVVWSTRDQNLIAASATNGAIVVFNVNNKRQVWSSGEAARSINKICWHPLEDNTLASCSQDGAIKIWDYRIKKDPCQAIFNCRNDPSRDINFNNFNSNSFASVYENGNVFIWDRRRIDQSILKLLNAHTTGGLSVAWHRSTEHVLASGGRDKTVKIWDLSSFTSAGGEFHGSDSGGLYPKPTHILHTAASVNRIAWRPNSPTQLCTISEKDVVVWDIMMPYIPLCVLKGHNEACMGLEWLDSPASNELDESIVSTSSSSINKYNAQNVAATSQGVWQHILSVGRDCRLLLQDLRHAWFPRQHMASNAVALSVRGHHATQWAQVNRSDLLGLTTISGNSSHWYVGDVEVSDKDGPKMGSLIEPTLTTTSDYLSGDNAFNCSSEMDRIGAIEGSHKSLSALPTLDWPMETPLTGILFVGTALDLEDESDVPIRSLAINYASVPHIINSPEALCLAYEDLANRLNCPSVALLWSSVAVLISGLLDETMSYRVGYARFAPLLIQLLNQLLDEGDCQHVVIIRELLRSYGLLSHIAGQWVTLSENESLINNINSGRISISFRIKEAYLSYWDLLYRLQLETIACDLADVSDIPELASRSKRDVDIRHNCGRCGKELRGPSDGSMRLPWCSRCKACSGLCVLCHSPVCGLMLWCQVCGHGGHKKCIRNWFDRIAPNRAASCPSGCGHVCVIPGINSLHPNTSHS